MQTFTLDLRTLLQILSRQKRHGLIQAEIPSDRLRIPGTRQVLQAGILLESGGIRACAIALRQGKRIAEGQEALQLLLEVGIIEWHWEGSAPPPALPSPREVPVPQTVITGRFPVTTMSIPRRTLAGDEVWQTLPREYRKILGLVDGQRSVQKLAAILAMKEEDVTNVLQVLRSRGLIV